MEVDVSDGVPTMNIQDIISQFGGASRSETLDQLYQRIKSQKQADQDAKMKAIRRLSSQSAPQPFLSVHDAFSQNSIQLEKYFQDQYGKDIQKGSRPAEGGGDDRRLSLQTEQELEEWKKLKYRIVQMEVDQSASDSDRFQDENGAPVEERSERYSEMGDEDEDAEWLQNYNSDSSDEYRPPKRPTGQRNEENLTQWLRDYAVNQHVVLTHNSNGQSGSSVDHMKETTEESLVEEISSSDDEMLVCKSETRDRKKVAARGLLESEDDGTIRPSWIASVASPATSLSASITPIACLSSFKRDSSAHRPKRFTVAERLSKKDVPHSTADQRHTRMQQCEAAVLECQLPESDLIEEQTSLESSGELLDSYANSSSVFPAETFDGLDPDLERSRTNAETSMEPALLSHPGDRGERCKSDEPSVEELRKPHGGAFEDSPHTLHGNGVSVSTKVPILNVGTLCSATVGQKELVSTPSDTPYLEPTPSDVTALEHTPTKTISQRPSLSMAEAIHSSPSYTMQGGVLSNHSSDTVVPGKNEAMISAVEQVAPDLLLVHDNVAGLTHPDTQNPNASEEYGEIPGNHSLQEGLQELGSSGEFMEDTGASLAPDLLSITDKRREDIEASADSFENEVTGKIEPSDARPACSTPVKIIGNSRRINRALEDVDSSQPERDNADTQSSIRTPVQKSVNVCRRPGKKSVPLSERKMSARERALQYSNKNRKALQRRRSEEPRKIASVPEANRRSTAPEISLRSLQKSHTAPVEVASPSDRTAIDPRRRANDYYRQCVDPLVKKRMARCKTSAPATARIADGNIGYNQAEEQREQEVPVDESLFLEGCRLICEIDDDLQAGYREIDPELRQRIRQICKKLPQQSSPSVSSQLI